MTTSALASVTPPVVADPLPPSVSAALVHIDRLIHLDLCRRGVVDEGAWHAYERGRQSGSAPSVAELAAALAGAPAHVLLLASARQDDRDAPIGAAVLARLLLRLGHRVSVYTEPGSESVLEVLLQAAVGAEAAPPVAAWGQADPSAAAALAQDHDRVCIVVGVCARNEVGDGPVSRIHRAAVRLGRPTLLVRQAPTGADADAVRRDERAWPRVMELVAATAATGVYGLAAALALLRDDPTLCATPEDEAGLALVAEALGVTGPLEAIGDWDAFPTEPRAAVVALLRSIVGRSLGGLRPAPARSPRA